MSHSGDDVASDRAFLRNVPAILVGSRFVFGPLLVWLTLDVRSPGWIVAVLVVAMLSDIFDGVIARRLRIVTAGLRVADSRADAWFFICVGVSAWLAVPQIIRAYAAPLLVEVALQIASYVYDLARYRRIASLHAYSAKIWGFTLYCAAGALLAFHYGQLIWLSFAFGVVSFVDATAIKLILPGWRHDVLSSIHAWRKRQSERSDTDRPAGM